MANALNAVGTFTSLNATAGNAVAHDG